jgi:adenylate cyclase
MGRTFQQRRRLISLLIVAALAGGLGVTAYATHLLRRQDLQSIDERFSIRGDSPPPSNIVFVGIDVPSFQALKHNFPFPRRWDAQVVDNLRSAGAATIAMDIEFAHKTVESEDLELYEAISRAHGKTVLAATEYTSRGETEIFGGTSNLREAGAVVGEDHLVSDSDGTVRNFARGESGLSSFGVAAAEVMTGHRYSASLFEGGTLPIDYLGSVGHFHYVSFSKVLRHEFASGTFAGKLVIVGSNQPVLHDEHPTPTANLMQGAEIWGNVAATLFRGVPLRRVPGWVNIMLVLLLGAAVPLGSLRLRGWRSLLDAVVLAVVFSVGVQVAFNSGRILTYVYPMLALALGTLGTLGTLYVSEAIERERVRSVFSRFVPADVVDEVLARTDENLRLGGVELDSTVMFSDLRGFTSFSESQPAARVIEVVNYYLNEMTEAILDAGGTLVAYMGDGIMAVFGAPLPQDDHADRALRAAREMIGSRLGHFNDWLAEQGFDHRFEMGVGLNSGPVMSGNVGSEQRVEYTALGDTTNTASRLEGMTKGSGVMLFISQTTRERLHEVPADIVPVGEVEIRGREQRLAVWTLGKPGE